MTTPRVQTVTCHHCGRTLHAQDWRYQRHSTTAKSPHPCPVSYQRVPRGGESDADWRHRARIVADLAWQMRDCDPMLVRAYLDGLLRSQPEELLRLFLVALTGVRVDPDASVDANLDQAFGWVAGLPGASSGVGVPA